MSSPRPKPVFFRRARFKLTFYYTALQLLFLVLLAVFVYHRSKRSMLGELEKFIRDDTYGLMAYVYDQKEEDWAAVQRRFDFESRGERYFELSFRLIDRQGKVLACSRAFREASVRAISEEELHDAFEGDAREEIVQLPGRLYPHLLVTRPSKDPQTKEIRYVVQTLAFLEPIERQMRRLRLAIYGSIPLFVLITWFGGYALARKVLKPITLITRTARQITSSNLNERLVRSKSGDELDMLAATLNEMIQRLEESFALTRQFAADAAHELRTPLTIMRGEAEVALRSRSDDPLAYREVLETMVREYDRMIHVITNLLLLSQADAGKAIATPEAVRLDELLREVAETFAVVAEGSDLTFQMGQLPPVTIHGDRVRLHELFANLLDNAVKYTPPGGSVAVTCTLAGESVQVAVSDSGIGIPADQQDKVFGRFYRVEGSRSRDTGGAGLGLSIARCIANAHGGRIELKSAPGAGSTFTVILPLPVEEDGQAETEPASA